MKIVGFAQLRNELEKDNLLNWFKCMESICSDIFIYDQNSTDGSLEEYKKHNNVHVIESPINDFSNEITCKSHLLDKLLKEKPDTEWIFWLDGDTLIDNRLLIPGAIETLCNESKSDAIILGHYNLWRSDVHYRVDALYHCLHESGVVALWRNNGDISFPKKGGLHQAQYPLGIRSMSRAKYSLIHRGFSTDKSIIQKYLNYRSRGQHGFDLDRLIDEKTLDVKILPDGLLPSWFNVTDSLLPNNKPKLIDLYKEELK